VRIGCRRGRSQLGLLRIEVRRRAGHRRGVGIGFEVEVVDRCGL
jgi:hypothetical protein